MHRIDLEGLDSNNIDIHIDADAIQAQVDAALSRIDFTEINEQATTAGTSDADGVGVLVCVEIEQMAGGDGSANRTDEARRMKTQLV